MKKILTTLSGVLVLALCLCLLSVADGQDLEGIHGNGADGSGKDTAVEIGVATEKDVARAVDNYIDSFRARDIFWAWEWSPFADLEENMNGVLKAQGWDTSGLESMLEEKKKAFKASKDNGLVAEAGEVFIRFKNNIDSVRNYDATWSEMKGLTESMTEALGGQDIGLQRLSTRDPGLEEMLKNPLRLQEIEARLVELFDTFVWEFSRLRDHWQQAGYRYSLFERPIELPVDRDDPDCAAAFNSVKQLAVSYRQAAENVGLLVEGEKLFSQYTQTLKDMGFETRLKDQVEEIKRNYHFNESDFTNVDKASHIWQMVIEIKRLVPPVVAFKLSLKGIMHGTSEYVSLGFKSQAARLEGCQVLSRGERFRELVTVKDISTDSAVLEHKGQTYTLTLRIADEIELMLPYKEGE